MSAFNHLLTPDVWRSLGLSLLHFLWQGAALAALSAAAFATLRNASTRYVIGLVTLVLMLSAPLFTFWTIRNHASTAAPTVPSVVLSANSSRLLGSSPVPANNSAAQTFPVGNLNLLVELWFVGVMLFSLRTAGGLFLISRLRRRDAQPLRPELLRLCREMQERLGLTRAIRFCESLQLDSPAVIGWFRPVVLLPMSALTGLSQTQLRAVIAHELAHIRRFDAFFNLFQVTAETLLFYHPAVWWLNQRIRAERENCCDDVALAACGNPTEYARALAQMEEWRMAPSLAMAANRGPLTSRVARLLGVPEQGSGLRNAAIAFSILCVGAALVTGTALFGVIRTATAHPTRHLPVAVASVQSPDGVIVVTAPRPAPLPQVAVDPISAVADTIPAQDPAQTSQAPKGSSYIDGMKAEGFTNLDADELIAFKVQGITPEFIHAIRAEGLKPTADELIGLKVQGITADYIRQVRAMKFDVDIDSIIGMKVQGITPEYVEEIRKLGFNVNGDELIGMKVQDITPEYIAEMRKLGFQPSADELIGMKVQGITPQYVHDLRELNINPDADTVIGLKVQGIDANYVRSIRATGLNPDADGFIGLKVQGIDADYIKSLQSAGFKVDADEVIGAKVMGITPQFVELARSKGFKNLDLDKLIQLKNANVLE